MTKKALSFVLVCAFACGAPAADRSANGKAGKPNAVPVSELLKQAAKSPPGPGEARLLRAVAELIEQEQVPVGHSRKGSLQPAMISYPRPVAVPALPPGPGSQAPPPEQRKRLAIRLSNAPIDDVVKALEEFLASEQKVQPADESIPRPCPLILVPEQVTNTLLISGSPKMVNSLTRRIAKLDVRPAMVMAQVCIANFVTPRSDAKPHGGSSDDSAAAKAPSMEDDGAAWLAWATKQGRLEVLTRPQIMTIVNQPAFIQIGSAVPRGAPKPGTDGPATPSTLGPAKAKSSEPANVGVTLGFTPRISAEGLIVMELDVQHASPVSRDGAGEPIIGKTTVQTTISAKDGQTVVVGGLTQRSPDGHRQLIIAVTPRVNVTKVEADRAIPDFDGPGDN